MISSGRWGGVEPGGRFPHTPPRCSPTPTAPAPAKPSPAAQRSRHLSHHSPPPASLGQGGHTQATPPPTVERSTAWKGGGVGFLHMQNPLPLAQGLDQHLFWGAGHSCCRGWGPGFSQCPVSSPPDTPKPLAPFQGTVSSISPHGPLLINCSNSERKEERAQTLKPWELVNQELKFKTYALSCPAPPPPPPPPPRFFSFSLQFC